MAAEVQYRTLIASEPIPEISRDPRELTYTWPLFVLAARRGALVETLRVQDVTTDLLCYLMTSLHFDHRVMEAEGVGVPASFKGLQQDLEKRGATAGRVLWQLLRDDPLAKSGSTSSLVDIMDSALTRAKLPELLSVIGETQRLVDTTRRAFEDGLKSELQEASNRQAIPDTLLMLGEIDLLQTSSRHLHVVASKLNTALGAPTALFADFDPAVVVYERPTHYEWSVVVPGDLPEAERRVLDARARLRQQIAIYEHILEQFVSGSHLGCYGSPEWPLPINACPHSATCLGLDVRAGIEFCVDDHWRRKVTVVLSAAARAAPEAISDEVVRGFRNAAELYDAWLSGVRRGSDEGLLETDWLGLPAHEPPNS